MFILKCSIFFNKKLQFKSGEKNHEHWKSEMV